MKTSVEIEIGGQELHVDVEYEPFKPGNTSGPPESCFPDEGGEVGFEAVRLFTGLVGLTRQYIDITDLITECGGADLVQEKVEEAFTAPNADDYDDGDNDE